MGQFGVLVIFGEHPGFWLEQRFGAAIQGFTVHAASAAKVPRGVNPLRAAAIECGLKVLHPQRPQGSGNWPAAWALMRQGNLVWFQPFVISNEGMEKYDTAQ
jgi:hypothetical protein